MRWSSSAVPSLAMPAMVIMGATGPAIFINFVVALIQEHTDPRLMGRVMSVYGLSFTSSLPIGFGQTISQPYVVARSCELARSGRALDMVLEIGGGCGYQAAVLGRLAREVYTIERIGALAAKARQTLSAAGVNNVKVRNADGREASSNVVQFDAIVVAAGGASIPPNLPGLLADGGRLVIPLGSPDHQKLTLVTRNGESFQQQAFDDVVFVPLKSGQE